MSSVRALSDLRRLLTAPLACHARNGASLCRYVHRQPALVVLYLGPHVLVYQVAVSAVERPPDDAVGNPHLPGYRQRGAYLRSHGGEPCRRPAAVHSAVPQYFRE